MQTTNAALVVEAKHAQRMLRPKEVRRRLGDISNATLYDWVAKGKLPPPVKLVDGGNASGWPESTINAIIQQRLATTQVAALAA